MKAIMMSIRPQWVVKILNGEKTIEVRKGTRLYKAINKLIAEQGVAPMLIYCTKGRKLIWLKENSRCEEYINGKVVARFNATAEEIECLGWDFSYDYHLYRTKELSPRELMLSSRVGYYALEDYLKGKNGIVIHINDLEIFDKPKELSEFQSTCNKSCAAQKVCGIKPNCNRPLTSAPQSWCYVEV